MKSNFKIIIIDDDERVLKMLKAKLANYSAVGFTEHNEGIDKIKKEKFDLLILDYLLIGTCAGKVIRDIRKFNNDIYIFLLTGCDKNMLHPLKTLQEMDIQFYCEKSADIDSIILNIENAIKSIEFLKRKKYNFATRLKELRASRGVGQDELAKYVGLGRTAVANWESGLTEPSSDNLKRIASFFKVTIDYLLCYEVEY